MKTQRTKTQLILTVDAGEQAFLRECFADDPDYFRSDEWLWDYLAQALTPLERIEPEEVSALTAAPILGMRAYTEDVLVCWWFADYAIRSVQEDLMNTGRAEFQNGEMIE